MLMVWISADWWWRIHHRQVVESMPPLSRMASLVGIDGRWRGTRFRGGLSLMALNSSSWRTFGGNESALRPSPNRLIYVGVIKYSGKLL